MFGFGGDKVEIQGGVREMRERARRLKKGLPLDAGKDRLEGPAPLPIVLGGYVFLVMLFGVTALLFRQHGLSFRLPLGTGINAALFGAPDGGSAAGAFTDAAFTAAAVCVLSALVCMVVHVWVRLRDEARANLYLSFWGVTAGLPFVVLLACDFVWPLLGDVLDVFTGF